MFLEYKVLISGSLIAGIHGNTQVLNVFRKQIGEFGSTAQ
jgi:hypothetical protein